MRYVAYKSQQRDPDSDEFMGITSAAMQLSSQDKGGLSVTWIEHFGLFNFQSKRLAAVAFRNSLDSKKLGGNAVFATAQVEKIVEAGISSGKSIRVVHDPVPNNGGHAEVRHFTKDDITLLDYLAIAIFDDIDKVSDLNIKNIL